MIAGQGLVNILSLFFPTLIFIMAHLLCSEFNSLTSLRDNRKDYEKGYKKFLGLVKKQEQLLRGKYKK